MNQVVQESRRDIKSSCRLCLREYSDCLREGLPRVRIFVVLGGWSLSSGHGLSPVDLEVLFLPSSAYRYRIIPASGQQ